MAHTGLHTPLRTPSACSSEPKALLTEGRVTGGRRAWGQCNNSPPGLHSFVIPLLNRPASFAPWAPCPIPTPIPTEQKNRATCAETDIPRGSKWQRAPLPERAKQTAKGQIPHRAKLKQTTELLSLLVSLCPEEQWWWFVPYCVCLHSITHMPRSS